MFKKDSLLLGLVPGIIVPIIAAFVMYGYHFGFVSWRDFYIRTTANGMLSSLLALGCLLNLGVFFLFIRLNKLDASKGVIIATMVYIGVTVYYKLL